MSELTRRPPSSARVLFVRSLFIHSVNPELLLYVDSGNDTFSEDDLAFFRRGGAQLDAEAGRLRGRGRGPPSVSSIQANRIPGRVLPAGIWPY